MNQLLYVVLGMMDIFVLLALLFKLFRWPLKFFWREALLIALVCSLESFLTRIVFQVPEIDLILQNATIILMMKWLMNVNWYYGITLSVTGSFAYSEVAFVTYNLFQFFGVPLHFADPTTLDVYLMQISGQAAGGLIAFALYKFNLGFSFVAIPPHDVKRSYTRREKINLYISSLAVVLIFSTVYLAINYGAYGINSLMVIELIALILLLYIARKQDFI